MRIAGVIEQASPALDAPSLGRSFGYGSTKHDLRHALGVTAGRAKGILAVARAATPRLGATGLPIEPLYPHVAEAIDAGVIAIHQARVVVEQLSAGGARVDPEGRLAAEAALVDAAVGEHAPGARGYDDTVPAPPEQLAVMARVWLQALDPDGAEPREDERIAERSFTFAQHADGNFYGDLVLPPDEGATVQAVLNAYCSPRTGDVFGDPGTIGDDERTDDQRRADVIAGLFAAHARSGDAPRPGTDAPTLLVAVTQEQIEEHARSGAGLCDIVETGETVPAALAARMLCGGFVQTALVDGQGHTLNLGRRKRLFTPAQRKAIMLRDRRCQGRDARSPPAGTRCTTCGHGSTGARPTPTTRSCLLCSRCHHAVHRGRLQIERAGSRWRVRRTMLPPVRRRRRWRRRPLFAPAGRAPAATG